MKKVPDTYKNIFDSKRVNGDIYKGAPDPFIIKVNGYYYLTSTVTNGISIKKSFDLIKWENVNENSGIVTIDNDLKHAFAPEIMYDNGKYYIVTSPSGRGHYLYCSNNIEGPFTLLHDNFHESIDGSFFKESDGSIYFTRASETGITMKKVKSFNDEFIFEDDGMTFKDAILGGWTEGPYIIKRYGYYYLTFTGTHFLSDAYRVGYVSGKKLDDTLKYRDFVVLSTDPDYMGLGHSMTFVGPDLDSYIMAYHNCDEKVKRNLCLTRLLFNEDGEMIVNGLQKEGNHLFKRPIFEDFSNFKDYLSAEDYGGQEFSLEYNVSGSNALMVFDYHDESDYKYFTLKKDGLYVGHKETLTELISFARELNVDVYHLVRVQFAKGKLALYIDGVEYMCEYKTPMVYGKIGYKNNQLDKAYIAYSKYSFGSSDYTDIIYHEDFYYYGSKVGNNIISIDVASEGKYDLVNISNNPTSIESIDINGHEMKVNDDIYLIRSVPLKKGINTLVISSSAKKVEHLRFSKSCLDNVDYDLAGLLKHGHVYGSYENRSNGIYFENDRNAILTNMDLDNYEVSLSLDLCGNPLLPQNVIGLIASVNSYASHNQFEGLCSLNGYMFMINKKYAYIYQANYHKTRLLKRVKVENKNNFTLKLIKDNESISFYIDNVKAFVTKIDIPHHLYQGRVGIYMNHASAIAKQFRLIQKKEE